MPSPFPGMDPYLEHPALWPGVHQGLITFMWSALNAMLPPQYVASMGERVYVVQPERDIYPDIMVMEHPSRPPLPAPVREGAAAVVDPPWVVTVEPVEIREVFIEILTVGEGGQVITVMEVLSPANKAAGQPGRDLYLTKQREILSSRAHLIEIDLLRRGEHTVAVPYESVRRKGTWAYLTCLHRGGDGQRYAIWAVTVRQRLPRIAVPLAPGDPDLALDLQAIFNRCYDEGAYARRINYAREPAPALSDEDTQWTDVLLREQRVRQ
jgi:Protein of unknown function (DUF4058)